MTTFVLVHGSWHGGWCWTKVVPRLEAAGCRAVALDLPGHGADATPVARISLASYATRIAEVVEAQPDPVVLVGHSMGGAAITQAAERCADRLAALVYLAAFVPADGVSVVDQAYLDEKSLLNGAVRLDPDRGTAALEDSIIDACFYGDCSASDIAFARARLCEDPLAPLTTPLALGERSVLDVPRVYIECLRDATLTIERQRGIQRECAWRRIYSLDTGHSPFFSAPDPLAGQLLASADVAR